MEKDLFGGEKMKKNKIYLAKRGDWIDELQNL